MCGLGAVRWGWEGGALTLLLEFLVLRLLQPRLRTDVVAAGLEEPGKDDRAADGVLGMSWPSGQLRPPSSQHDS